jgi:hypothetical protein
MRTRSPRRWLPCAVLLGCVGAHRPACAQTNFTYQATATFSVTWSEVDPAGQPIADPNGLLEPDEGARISVTISVAPAIGTSVTYYTQGSNDPHTGTVAGLGHGFFDLSAPGGEGSWLIDHPFRPEWDYSMAAWGTVANSGAWVQFINPAQWPFPASPGEINPENPVADIWHGVWFPESFAPRNVQWRVSEPFVFGYVSSVFLVTSPTEFVVAMSEFNAGAVQIPIVPAPEAMCAFAAAIALAAQSRRRA